MRGGMAGRLATTLGLRTADQLPSRKQFGPLGPATAGPSEGQPAAPSAPKYKAGDRVRHQKFGEGVVVESTLTRRGEEEVKVQFESAGPRTLLGALAPMETF